MTKKEAKTQIGIYFSILNMQHHYGFYWEKVGYIFLPEFLPPSQGLLTLIPTNHNPQSKGVRYAPLIL